MIAVAPDAGASKLVTHFGRALGIRCAIASKFRAPSGDAEITEIIGDFSGVRVAASHNLCVGPARGRLADLHARAVNRIRFERSVSEAFVGLP